MISQTAFCQGISLIYLIQINTLEILSHNALYVRDVVLLVSEFVITFLCLLLGMALRSLLQVGGFIVIVNSLSFCLLESFGDFLTNTLILIILNLVVFALIKYYSILQQHFYHLKNSSQFWHYSLTKYYSYDHQYISYKAKDYPY